jgi:hypothetical protein
MSIKNKNKNDDNESVIIGRVISAIIIFYVIEQAEQIIKVKESKSFSGNREAFSEYITLIRLFI